MKKSTLFLSAAITTFIVVIVSSLLLKVRAGAVVVPTDTLVPTDTATLAPTDTTQPTDTATTLPPTPSGVITPQEAAFIASAALGNTKIYSVDTVNRYGMDVYQVNFSSGAIVIVAPDGHIMLITQLQSSVVVPTPDQQNPPANNNPPPNKKPKPTPPPGGGDD